MTPAPATPAAASFRTWPRWGGSGIRTAGRRRKTSTGIGERVGQMHQEVDTQTQLRIGLALGVQVAAGLHVYGDGSQQFQLFAIGLAFGSQREEGAAIQFFPQSGQVAADPGPQELLRLPNGERGRMGGHGYHTIGLIGGTRGISKVIFRSAHRSSSKCPLPAFATHTPPEYQGHSPRLFHAFSIETSRAFTDVYQE